MRYAIKVEYDGTNYGGWQRQRNALTVQEVLEAALKGMAGNPVAVTGASRTDAGVHARGQVAHFDAELSVPPHKLFLAMNTRLPPDIRVCASCEAPEGFHARFDAEGKRYLYAISNSTYASAIMRNYCAFVPGDLDVEKMREAARLFVGTHDFRCAMAAGSSATTTVRTVYAIGVQREGDKIDLDVRGNGFLYNMVRIFAGTLIRAGQGKLTIGEIQSAMDCGDRTLLGFTAPAKGLTLMEVYYKNRLF